MFSVKPVIPGIQHRYIDRQEMKKVQSKNILAPRVEEEKVKLYPWSLLWKTSLLWFSFFALGLSDSIQGPTLLDLKDLINEDVSAVSSIFALKSFGGLLGCFYHH